MTKITFPLDRTIDLPRYGSWPETKHRFDSDSANALNAAMAAQRPLLVRGEPGTGKSQLARAAAVLLNRVLVAEVVHARSESQDLHWHFDAVGRLGEAQALGATAGEANPLHGKRAVESKLDPLRYLAPGALWWAFDWESAERQYAFSRFKHRRPEPPKGWTPMQGGVVLIDEIDKADADLPNGLLETLGNGGFSMPYRDQPVALPKGAIAPLVIITTNEERELPAAFVRRCFVLHLWLPDDDPEYAEESEQTRLRHLQNWLVERGTDHHGERIHPDVLRTAASQLCEDRNKARGQGVSPPGQAEYLDLLRALDDLAPVNPKAQQTLLGEIQDFAFKKYQGLF